MKANLLCLIACLMSFQSVSEAADEFEFTDTFVALLASDDTVSIKYLLQGDELILNLQTQVTDFTFGNWIGFGIGENRTGSMKGADIVTVYLNPRTGKPVAEDRHVGWYTFPMDPGTVFPDLDSDDSQDWIALSGEITDDNVLSITVKRKLDTGDREQDRVIDPNFQNRIIVAKGVGSGVSYHSNDRVGTALDFSRKVPPTEIQLPADVTGSVEIRMGDYDGFKDRTTTYACRAFTFDLGEDGTDEYDIVAFEPLLDKENLKLLHHMVIYHCSKPHGKVLNETLDGCDDVIEETGADECFAIIYAWAVGGANLIFPEDIGLRIGPNPGQIRDITFEFHYDNPQHLQRSDNSGVKIHYTKHLREKEAYVLTLGDPSVTFAPLQPKEQCQSRRGYCPVECSSTFEHPIHAFMNLHHMHARGRQAYTKLNGKIMTRLDYWDFAFQNFVPVDYTINPGDRLETVCNYDAARDEEEVFFDLGSLDEMCQDFVYYYPRTRTGSNCGHFEVNAPGFDVNTMCGTSGFLDVPDQNQFGGAFLDAEFLSKEAVCSTNLELPSPTPFPTNPPTKKAPTTSKGRKSSPVILMTAIVSGIIYTLV